MLPLDGFTVLPNGCVVRPEAHQALRVVAQISGRDFCGGPSLEAGGFSEVDSLHTNGAQEAANSVVGGGV